MGQNIKRAVTPQNHVTHGPKDSMVRSEGKHSVSSHEINYQNMLNHQTTRRLNSENTMQDLDLRN